MCQWDLPAGGLDFYQNQNELYGLFLVVLPYVCAGNIERYRSIGFHNYDIPCGGPSFLKRPKTKQKGHALQAKSLLALYHRGRKVTKTVFATNHPFGFLGDFESDRPGGPRKQPFLADSALCANHGA